MDEQKTHKILLAVLAVVVIAAGGYWFVARDNGASTTQKMDTIPHERKERRSEVLTNEKAGRKDRAKTSTADRSEERRERITRSPTTSGRKNRTKRNRKTVKKEELRPAA